MEIHDLQDKYEFDKIAVLGERSADEQWLTNDSSSCVPVGKINILSQMLESNLMTNSEHLVPFLKTTFGLKLQPVNQTVRNQMLGTEWGRKMNCWPAANSMTVVDDVLVIKLSNQ